jgi:RNA polymerase primary sigma factor
LTISSLAPVEEKYSSVKQLIELGKEKGYLLYDEIYEMLPEEVVSLPDELDEIYIRFADLGIDVIDRPERYQNRDDFESGASEFDKMEDETTEFGLATHDKTNDPVRMYLREMGTVPISRRYMRTGSFVFSWLVRPNSVVSSSFLSNSLGPDSKSSRF